MKLNTKSRGPRTRRSYFGKKWKIDIPRRFGAIFRRNEDRINEEIRYILCVYPAIDWIHIVLTMIHSVMFEPKLFKKWNSSPRVYVTRKHIRVNCSFSISVFENYWYQGITPTIGNVKEQYDASRATFHSYTKYYSSHLESMIVWSYIIGNLENMIQIYQILSVSLKKDALFCLFYLHPTRSPQSRWDLVGLSMEDRTRDKSWPNIWNNGSTWLL